MAQESSMDAATLNKVANDCRDAKDLIRKQANDVDSAKLTVLAGWQSPAAKAFGGAVDLWGQKADALIADVDRIAGLMDTTATQNVNQDADLEGSFGRFGQMLA